MEHAIWMQSPVAWLPPTPRITIPQKNPAGATQWRETRGKVPMNLALLSSGLKAGCAPTNKKPPHSRVIQLVVTMTKDRVNEIDLLRFIAAIAVLFFHYSFRGACLRRSVHHALPLDYSSCKVWISGGVQLFFMISGFVIFMTASNANLKSFATSRIVRLYPTFCGMLHHYVHCNPVDGQWPLFSFFYSIPRQHDNA